MPTPSLDFYKSHPIPEVAHMAIPYTSKMLDPKDPSSYRPDGSLKGPGFLGVYKNPKGQNVTEYSVGIEIDGKEMDVPSLVPGLSPEQISSIVNTGQIPESAMNVIEDHARSRISEGKSVFADDSDYEKFMTSKTSD